MHTTKTTTKNTTIQTSNLLLFVVQAIVVCFLATIVPVVNSQQQRPQQDLEDFFPRPCFSQLDKVVPCFYEHAQECNPCLDVNQVVTFEEFVSLMDPQQPYNEPCTQLCDLIECCESCQDVILELYVCWGRSLTSAVAAAAAATTTNTTTNSSTTNNTEETSSTEAAAAASWWQDCAVECMILADDDDEETIINGSSNTNETDTR